MSTDPVGIGPPVRARIRRVVDYCAKLGRRRGADDTDLFTVLPTLYCRPLHDRNDRPEFARIPDKLCSLTSIVFDAIDPRPDIGPNCRHTVGPMLVAVTGRPV